MPTGPDGSVPLWSLVDEAAAFREITAAGGMLAYCRRIEQPPAWVDRAVQLAELDALTVALRDGVDDLDRRMAEVAAKALTPYWVEGGHRA